MTRVRLPSSAATSHSQIDGRAVLPQTLELVVGPLLLVLDVHDDVREVDQDPSAVALTFAANRLHAELAKLVLGGCGDSLGQINGMLRGGHAVLLVIVLFEVVELPGVCCGSAGDESVGTSRL